MLCVQVCPKSALRESHRLSDSGAEMVEFDEAAGCTGCTLCTFICPDAAIEIVEEEEAEAPGTKSGK